MIARLRGKLIEASLTAAIIDVNGVGYRVFIPLSTFDKLPRPGETVEILTYMNVREDAIQLYGFATAQEKDLFELLINVNGVGAKTAVNVLSGTPVSTFCAAIASADIKALSKINGIGKKTAERMIIELRDKVDKISPEAGFTSIKVSDDKKPAVEDALMALEQLGFKRDKSQKVIVDLLAKLDSKECSTENLVRKALQALNS